MATPVGHLLAGGVVAAVMGRFPFTRQWHLILCVSIAANLPDIDMFFGYFIGQPSYYHHMWTHSIAFILMTSICILGLALLRKNKAPVRLTLIWAAAMLTHLLIDLATIDNSSPYGMQLYWPLSREFFIGPFHLFADIYKSSSSNDFIASMFCWHNGMTVLREIVILGPLLLLIPMLKRRLVEIQNKKHPSID
ncbi:metal-dependent hydrolase [bacterium]|nr:metal-dependent hydrolase [bacterium]